MVLATTAHGSKPLNQKANMKVKCEFPDLDHVETTPQSDLDRHYVDFLLAQLHDHKRLEQEAMVWVSRGETRRAYAILSQAVNS